MSAIVWGVIAAALHARIVFRMADMDAIAAPGLWNVAMVDAGLIGFLIIFILGVSTRAIVGFLSLKPTRRWLSWIALVLLNIGTGWYVLARYNSASDETAAIELLVQAAGFVAFIVALRIFESSAQKTTYIEGTYSRYEWFVRAAFGWLLVAAVLMTLDAIGMLADDRILGNPLSAPITHALTLGFVTMVIFGVGIRMLTLFEGSEALMHWLLDVAFGALNIGVALRVGFGFGWFSGGLGLLSLVAFGIVLRRSFSPEQRAKYARRAAAAGMERFAQVRMGGARPRSASGMSMSAAPGSSSGTGLRISDSSNVSPTDSTPAEGDQA